MQNTLEDVGSFSIASKIFTLSGGKNSKTLSTASLLPFVKTVATYPECKKTHVAAWFNRVAAQRVYEQRIAKKRGGDINMMNDDVVDIAAQFLMHHRDGTVDKLVLPQRVIDIYKYCSNVVLAFHCYLLEMRCDELKCVFRGNATFPKTSLTVAENENLNVPRELADDFFDKHTKEGKAMGRGYGHFFEVMYLKNRRYSLPDGAPPTSRRGGVEPWEAEAKGYYLDVKVKVPRKSGPNEGE